MSFFNRLAFVLSIFFKKLYANLQLLRGIWKITKIKGPIVTIFGGARLLLDDTYALQAHQFAQKLVLEDISVMTGGGPGIMEAASCGAITTKNKDTISLGIGVKEINEVKNPCVQEYLEVNYLSTRKWLLTHYSKAFVVFPGGFGTLDELSEIIILMQTKQLSKAPIILIGTEYWDYFMRWITREAVEHGVITQEQLKLFTITDDLEQAFCLVEQTCQQCPERSKA